MDSAPIQREAFRPQGRPRHALVPVLLRLIAIAGFAFAGWIALSALADSAFAAEQPQPAAQAGDQGPATVRHLATVRHFTSGPGGRTITDDVREIGDHPMRYVRSRQRDLFDDKDRAVRQVRELGDAVGVPRVRVPAVGPARPVLRGLVQRVTDAPPAGRPAAEERPEKQGVPAGAAHQAAAGDAVSAIHHHAAAAATAPAVQKAGGCPHCRDDHRAPAVPVPGPVQDGPQGGGSAGGHPFPTVGDLPHRRNPVAPPAVAAGTFQRTALTDVAAPGGPSVVPD
ncbi:hypothetical protein [Actinomadura latina]|uniref:Uncharacterized protein n=1 Tax=Actinomadura latina TaxID=163603 RepID=A0A846Z4C5_9ACTN|nr:hypothetical protein [Actinomadura latina]NKZ08210.1 hypothetical protein [Actinomadura latina]